MPIDTRIDAETSSCRATAHWLNETARGTYGSATNINTARTGSADCWSGIAAESFRGTAGHLRAESDRLAARVQEAASALDTFAHSVGVVKNLMTEARNVAARGGLAISDDVIQDPAPVPAPLAVTQPGSAPLPVEQVETHRHAVLAAHNQRQAFERARTIADDARSGYAEAQQKLVDEMNKDSRLADVKAALVNLQRALGFYSTPYGLVTDWKKIADQLGRRAEIWERLSANPTMSSAGRSLAYSKFIDNELLAARANGIVGNQNKTLGALALGMDRTRMGKAVLTGLTANPGRFVENGSGVWSKVAHPVLRNVPYAGVIMTGSGVGLDMANGKSWHHAVARNVLPFAAGTASTAGALAIAAGALTGPVGLGAVALGIGVSWGVGELVDHFYEE